MEFADILCPYCAKANQQVIPQIKSNYIDTGKVHYEVRLVAMIAPDSQHAGEGAYCAAKQGKFWNYLDTATMIFRPTTTTVASRHKTLPHLTNPILLALLIKLDYAVRRGSNVWMKGSMPTSSNKIAKKCGRLRPMVRRTLLLMAKIIMDHRRLQHSKPSSMLHLMHQRANHNENTSSIAVAVFT